MTLRALVTNSGDGTVSTFTVDGQTLHREAVSEVGAGCSTLAIDAARGLVHVGVKTPGTGVATCRFDSDTGALTPIAFTATEGTVHYLALTPAADRLLAACYHDGVGLVWAVDDGLPGEVTGRVEYPNLHSVVSSRDGAFCYFVSLGADLVAGYRFASDGSLTPLAPAPAPPGSGPRHIVLTSAGDRAYVLTEFSGQALVFWRDVESGQLTFAGAADAFDPDRGLRHSRFGADPRAEHLIWGADLQLSGDERFVWCSERTESTISTLPVREDGLGAATDFVVTQPQPRGFAVSPDGDYLLATGELSREVSLYAPQPDGTLRLLDTAETGSTANWVRFWA